MREREKMGSSSTYENKFKALRICGVIGSRSLVQTRRSQVVSAVTWHHVTLRTATLSRQRRCTVFQRRNFQAGHRQFQFEARILVRCGKFQDKVRVAYRCV